MAIISWIYIKCGYCQSDPQNVAIVCWIYQKCSHWQSGPQNVVTDSWFKKMFYLPVSYKKMAIISWVYIKWGPCQSGSQNMASGSQVYRKMWPLSVRSTKCCYCQPELFKMCHCQSFPQNEATVGWIYINCGYKKSGQCHSDPQNVVNVSSVFTKYCHCQIGPQNAAIVSLDYKKWDHC